MRGPRKKLKDGFVPLNRAAVTDVLNGLPPGPGLLFVRLMLEADHKSGTLRASFRELADQFGLPFSTFRRWLQHLKDEGVVVVSPGSNQWGPTIIAISGYATIQGEVAVPTMDTAAEGEPDGSAIAVPDMDTATLGDVLTAVLTGVSTVNTADPSRPAETRPKKSRSQEEEDNKVAVVNDGGLRECIQCEVLHEADECPQCRKPTKARR